MSDVRYHIPTGEQAQQPSREQREEFAAWLRQIEKWRELLRTRRRERESRPEMRERRRLEAFRAEKEAFLEQTQKNIDELVSRGPGVSRG